MTKQDKYKYLEEFPNYKLQGNLLDIVAMLNEMVQKHGIDVQLNDSGELFTVREETDEEYAERLAQEAKWAAQALARQEAKDVEDYARLKLKYGDS